MTSRSSGNESDRRTWRRLALWVLALVFVGTHWPRLNLEALWIGSDKLLHAGLFGGLFYLWYRARVIERCLTLWIVALVYSGFDEWSQSLPFINRHTSVADFIADAVGVTVVAVFTALHQNRVRGVPSRWRLLLRHAAVRSLLQSPQAWAAVLASAALGALLVMPVALMMFRGAMDRSAVTQGLWGALTGALIAGHIAIQFGVRHHAKRICAGRNCLHCDQSIPDVVVDDSGAGACPLCHEAVHSGSWVEPPSKSQTITWSDARRDCWKLIGLPLLGNLGNGVFIFVGAVLWMKSTYPSDVGLGLVVLGGGATIIIIASFEPLLKWSTTRADKEGEMCLRCRHDLRATASVKGIGNCPECGGKFPRFLDFSPDRRAEQA
ncbi:MAG: VanZ family protein [Phycisphaerales bacterium]|nr:VanZ family protein [Phycisphaerales bacterium]